MSRIGRQPITVPAGVTVAIEPERVTVNGPKGELTERINRDMIVKHADETVTVSRPTDRGQHRALHGLTRTLIANMVTGVTDGYEKRLEIQGVGYRAALRGRDLELAKRVFAIRAQRLVAHQLLEEREGRGLILGLAELVERDEIRGLLGLEAKELRQRAKLR